MTSIPREAQVDNIKSQVHATRPQVHTNGLITHEEATAEAEMERKHVSYIGRASDDDGFAQCFNDLHGNQFVFTPERGWLHRGPKDTHWVYKGAEAALERAIVYMMRERASVVSLAAAQDPDNAARYDAILKKSIPNSNRVTAIKSMLESLLFGTLDDFDRSPDMLNCANGVIDLRTGELSPHCPEQKYTYCIPVEYKPNADQSPWVNWLTNTLGGNVLETVRYLQLATGYSLTGHTWEEILFYLYGPTRSGKGTFTETINCMLGDTLSTEVGFGMFTSERGGDNQNFDQAPLKPCRVVLASESKQYERFNEAMVKSITGGNKIYCAFKHKEHFNYRPQFKIWLSSNHPVNADPDDDAVWGRIRVIGFPNSYLGKEDKALKDEMKSQANLEGVLAWAVQGAIEWYRLRESGGLPELEDNAREKDRQRNELDDVQAWIDECCVTGDNKFTPNNMLYPSYERWCNENGVSPKKKRALNTVLERKGFTRDIRTTNGVTKRGMAGVGVVQNYE